MGRRHHRLQRRLDRVFRIGEEGGDAGERLVGFGIEDMEDRTDEERVAGLLPMVSFFERAFRIDQHIGDVLDVAYLPLAAPDFEQWIVSRGFWIGRIEQHHAAMQRAEARGELPVLALDVVDDGRSRPGEQGRDDEAHPLAGSCRGKAQHMLRAIVTEVVAVQLAEYDAVWTKQPRRFDLTACSPAGRAVGLCVLGFSGAPH
jgi:hypothetical protein